MVLVSGKFDVKMTPQTLSEIATPAGLGRFALDKRFHGALDATSRGEMLSFRSAVEGSAGYVAMERVEGALDGRSGSFVLQHSGTMERGGKKLSLTVVPDSGTGELAGLAGAMAIEIVDGQHNYSFEYSVTGA